MTKSIDSESAVPGTTVPQAPAEISDFWDLAYRAGDHLEHWESPHPPAELAALVAAEILTPGATVLDVGCGSGSETLFLAQCGFRAIGVDRSGEALRIARQRSEKAALAVEWRRGDAFDLPLMDNSVDGVIDRGCFHLIPPRDRPLFACQIDRVLRPGGTVILRGSARDDEEAGLWALDARQVDRAFLPERFDRGPLVPVVLQSRSEDLAGKLVLLKKRIG